MVSVAVSLLSLVSAWIQPRVDVCGPAIRKWRSSLDERCLEMRDSKDVHILSFISPRLPSPFRSFHPGPTAKSEKHNSN